jgi:GT2 family glycosyltransferase
MAVIAFTKRLSIIFLNYNKLAETRQTVEQLTRLCESKSEIEIIAVDNGSGDGTAEYLKSKEEIKSILLEENIGIAGYNKGFQQASGQYFLVLDDDSSPQSMESVANMMKILDDRDDIGIIACHIESPDGTAQSSWHLPKKECFGPSPFFIGCGFIIRSELFRSINWYPENFFLYQNEIDIAFKVRMKGFKIYYSPDCVVIHRGIPSQRPGWRRVYYPTRNTIWLIQHYYPQPQASYMIASRLVIGLVRALQFRQMVNYLKAVKDAFRQPHSKQNLSGEILKDSEEFWHQNSIFHYLFRMNRKSW